MLSIPASCFDQLSQKATLRFIERIVDVCNFESDDWVTDEGQFKAFALQAFEKHKALQELNAYGASIWLLCAYKQGQHQMLFSQSLSNQSSMLDQAAKNGLSGDFIERLHTEFGRLRYATVPIFDASAVPCGLNAWRIKKYFDKQQNSARTFDLSPFVAANGQHIKTQPHKVWEVFYLGLESPEEFIKNAFSEESFNADVSFQLVCTKKSAQVYGFEQLVKLLSHWLRLFEQDLVKKDSLQCQQTEVLVYVPEHGRQHGQLPICSFKVVDCRQKSLTVKWLSSGAQKVDFFKQFSEAPQDESSSFNWPKLLQGLPLAEPKNAKVHEFKLEVAPNDFRGEVNLDYSWQPKTGVDSTEFADAFNWHCTLNYEVHVPPRFMNLSFTFLDQPLQANVMALVQDALVWQGKQEVVLAGLSQLMAEPLVLAEKKLPLVSTSDLVTDSAMGVLSISKPVIGFCVLKWVLKYCATQGCVVASFQVHLTDLHLHAQKNCPWIGQLTYETKLASACLLGEWLING